MEGQEQSNLLNEILTFSHRVRTKNKLKIQEKKTIHSINALDKGGNVFFNYFKTKIFSMKIQNK